MKPYSLILLAGLLLAAVPALAANPQPINYTHPDIAADATVQINNLAGNVKIVGWSKNVVRVTGTLGNSDERLEVSGDKNNFEIRVVYPSYNWPDDEGRRHSRMHGTDLIVQVPQGATIQATTVSAPITGNDLTGTLHLQSVSGDITLACKSSEINAQSVSGSVNVNGSAASAHIEMDSVSGNAYATGVLGELIGQSVSGSVSVDNSRLSRATLSTTSGRAEFNSSVQAGGNYKFNTVSGRIELNLPKQPDAEIDLRTFAGSIHNSFGPKPEKVSKYTSSMKLHFTSGKGGAYLSANSMSGQIVLKAGS